MVSPVRKMGIDFDTGAKGSTLLISGMGRSGTTWLSEVINYDNRYRDIFEPFLAGKVREAQEFRYYHYIRPVDDIPDLAGQARRILAGKVRSGWTDQSNRKRLSFRRIIKDIRTNLMLKWLVGLRPGMPIILLVRHPLAIVSSWRKLKWGVEAGGTISDFDGIVAQENLLNDFPRIVEARDRIDRDDYFEQLLFLWGVLYSVPLYQQTGTEWLVVFYENLLLQPREEFARVFDFVGRTVSTEKIMGTVLKPSKTNFLRKDFRNSAAAMVNKWKGDFTATEIARAGEIVRIFGLDGLYDRNGLPRGI